ncbi:PAS domain S-box protein [Flavobacterium luteum]|uniref:PAS domain S-box protein n=1 Tax=Flavobacterium luteum TaxID=2026654 RepID=A0A7J5AGU3_9FLAO|nr:PAS domain S-box protein [Flavobacterium luteum]KAB1156811.1 PAS domain S-box protein [Flavobacterium luteum]
MEQFNFSIAKFNKLFPFYILIDVKLNIKSVGNSLSRILPNLIENTSFNDYFFIKRPFVKLLEKDTIQDVINQLVVIESYLDRSILLKGQFELLDENLLFIGSPWFYSIEDLNEKNLTINDFAFHDPLLDLLHVQKNQDIANSELKLLLNTINNQKILLKKDKEELTKFSLAASANNSGVVFTKSNGEIVWANEAYLILTGCSIENVIGKTLLEIVDFEFANPEVLGEVMVAFYKGESFDFEILHQRNRNDFFWARIKGQLFSETTEDAISYFVTFEDISKEKDSVDQLKESENRLASLIVNLQTGILLEDENRKILLVNKQFCEIFGIDLPPEIMIGWDCSNSAEDTKHYFKSEDTFVSRIEEILQNRETVLSEILELTDGRIFERSYTPIYRDKQYKGHLWSYTDVTININYKENLQNQKERYRGIISNMNLGLIEIDNEESILLANETFCEMSGFSINELIGKKKSDIFRALESVYKTNPNFENPNSSTLDSYELKIKNKKNKESRDWLVSRSLKHNINGMIIGGICVYFDITEKNVLQAQKEQLLKRLENQNIHLNEYAHVVSHDLKSPLRSIHSLVQWIKEDNDTVFNEKTTNYFSLIQDKVEKMDLLIQGILNYSSLENNKFAKELVDLNIIIKNILDVIEIPSHIDICVKNKLPIITHDRYKMMQLFQNLIENAIFYNDKPKGIITISYTEDNEKYTFSVKDNGPGIAKENQERIFQIFQSLETNKKNNGIGLSIVKTIIEKANGKVWVESIENKGATFFFTVNKEI